MWDSSIEWRRGWVRCCVEDRCPLMSQAYLSAIPPTVVHASHPLSEDHLPPCLLSPTHFFLFWSSSFCPLLPFYIYGIVSGCFWGKPAKMWRKGMIGPPGLLPPIVGASGTPPAWGPRQYLWSLGCLSRKQLD